MKYNLNHKEEEVMQILWKLKKAFVKEIIEEMPDPKPPYNTVSSIIRKLEAAGLIGHEAFGKTHRYFAILEKQQYRKTAFKSFLSNYFGGSVEQVVSYFVQEEKVSPKELEELVEKIKNAKEGDDE